MQIELSDDEAAALVQELHNIVEKRPVSALAKHPHPERHTRQTPARAGP